MQIKHCGFYHKEKETCNLLPEFYDNGLNYRFVTCEKVPISKCPYKLYIKGEITKGQLNDWVKELKQDD